MTAHTTLSAKGQVVIPKDVRDRLGLSPGDKLDVVESHGGVWLKKHRAKSGRSQDDLLAEIRQIIDYKGPAVTIEEMNETIDDCWRRAALDSDV